MIESKKKGLKKEEAQGVDIPAKEAFLPEFDLKAKKADKIYNVSSIVNAEEFDLLDISDY